MPALVEYFEPVLKKVYDTQRSVAAAMYAEFINQQCAGDLSLMNRLKNGLLAKLVDPSHCRFENNAPFIYFFLGLSSTAKGEGLAHHLLSLFCPSCALLFSFFAFF